MELDTQELERAEPRHRLRIAAAGVWHNVLIFVGTYVFMLFLPRECDGGGSGGAPPMFACSPACCYCDTFLLAPCRVCSATVLLAPVYTHGAGVAVVSVEPSSPLANAVRLGDVITSVGTSALRGGRQAGRPEESVGNSVLGPSLFNLTRPFATAPSPPPHPFCSS